MGEKWQYGWGLSQLNRMKKPQPSTPWHLAPTQDCQLQLQGERGAVVRSPSRTKLAMTPA